MPRIADPMNFRGETLISKEELVPTQTYSGGKTTLTADFDGTALDPY